MPSPKKWSLSIMRGGGGGSFTRGSSYRALTANNLAFWIGGRLWEVVTYERWSHMEVRLYVLLSSFLLNCHISDAFQPR